MGNYKDESFSYVVMRKEGDSSDDQMTGMEEIEGKESWSRVVQAPTKSKGHVLMHLCTPRGSIEKVTVTRGKTYKAARKSSWGGLWPWEGSLND